MKITRGKDSYYVSTINTPHYRVSEGDNGFFVEWLPHILECLKQDRYLAWFSGIDLVRTNYQTTLNARCNKDTPVSVIGELARHSMIVDYQMNHIVHQCFTELRML